MGDLTGKVIGLFSALFIGAILLPVAITQIFDANTTGWDATTTTVFELLPVIVIIAGVIGFLGYMKMR